MGYGDDIIASGMARGMKAQGKRAAFGDGKRIIWGPWSEEMFRYNPNIAQPGMERADDICWVNYYKGNRHYNKLDKVNAKWIWNYDFHPAPGELFFSDEEKEFAESAGKGFILIEPNVPWHKSVARNKDWGIKNYQAVADLLRKNGYDVVQTLYNGGKNLGRVRSVKTPTFRHALALMSQAKIVITPEGGLHHGAAALGLPAVVLFGGFIPPGTTGYPGHVNLTGGVEACGSLNPCPHCVDAMNKITVEEVYSKTRQWL